MIKLQSLHTLLFSTFFPEQAIDMAVVTGHLPLTNYNGSQHRTQGALLLAMLIVRTDPRGDAEKGDAEQTERTEA